MLRLGHLGPLKAAKGYHFVDGPYVEYTCTPEFSMSPEEISRLPELLNEVLNGMISDSQDTLVQYLRNEDAGVLCQSDLKGYPDEVRVVTIAGNPCPCGGTHVTNTNQLSGLQVTKAKTKKKILKISYTFLA